MKIMNKKEGFITGLWVIYSVGAGLLGVYMANGKYPTDVTFFTWALFAQVILAIWCAFSSITNVFIKKHSLFKIPPPKRFKQKVTPIYKLNVWDNEWYVIKYELQWNNHHKYLSILVPFSSLFETYQYEDVGSYWFDYDLEGVTNIGALWEEKYAKENAQFLAEKAEKQKRLDKVAELNKTFNENYE